MNENYSIQNYCRICASNSPDIRNIFEVAYKEKLLSDILGQCLQCTIYRTEYLPEYICSECCADLIKMQKFIANYEKSEKWFMSRYNAINKGKLIKTETACPIEFEQIPEISLNPKHQIFVESLANTVPVQDPPPNPLELKEEFDHDWLNEVEMNELPASPNGSNLEISELNEAKCYEPEILLAEYSDVINKDTVGKATEDNEMIRHQTEPRRNECSICFKQFRNLEYLSKHENLHTIATHHCSLCPQVFKTKRALYSHANRHTGKLYQCKYGCDLQFISNSGRAKHHRNIHVAPKSYECFDCKRVFKYRLDLCRHMETHSSNGRVTFECEICLKPFLQQQAFIKHKRKHKAQIFDCEYCNESFEKKLELNSHVREMHADNLEQYNCDQCSKCFPLKSTLKAHIYNFHAGQENHLCTECGRTFLTNYLLKLHLQNHSDERPFACNQCPSTFKRKAMLQGHMRVHSPERYFICEVVVDGGQICGRKLQTASGLRGHKKSHSDRDKPFQCQSCSAKFFKNYSLQVHTRIHTGERPFKCEHCDRAFTQKGDMMKHMVNHLGPTPHKCTECGESFRLETELRKHSYSHFKPPQN